MGFNMADLEKLMSFDQDSRNYVKANEGYNPNIYLDTKKIPTTGYGFNLKAEHIRKFIPQDVLAGKRALTERESNIVFEQAYTQAVKDAQRFVGLDTFKKLPENAKKAVIDMSYNLGLSSLMGFNKLKQALQKGDLQKASNEIINSKYAQVDVPARAKRNAKLLLIK